MGYTRGMDKPPTPDADPILDRRLTAIEKRLDAMDGRFATLLLRLSARPDLNRHRLPPDDGPET